MQWPTLIVDNFFTDPHAIVSLSQKFKYKRDEQNRWPGTRTPSMHEANVDFFQWSTRKIIALLYPAQVMSEGAVQCKLNSIFSAYRVTLMEKKVGCMEMDLRSLLQLSI